MSEAKKERRIKKYGRPKSRDIQIVEPIWVNFMKAGEWNPAHFHAGCISCVMYLQVPKEIEDEKLYDHSVANAIANDNVKQTIEKNKKLTGQ